MLIKTTITGKLWGWYTYQGYEFKSDQVLTAANSIKVLMEPGQGELGTSLAALDRVIPSILFANNTLPEIINGKYVTYIQPQYANWVNASDVTTWIETIIPTLNLPNGDNFMFALSLGGLAVQYLSQATASVNFKGIAIYDGYIQGTVPINSTIFASHCKSILIVANVNDSTVNTINNSQVLYDSLKNVISANLVLQPFATHDSWDNGFNPTNKGSDSFFQYLTSQITAPVVVPPIVVVPVPVVPVISDNMVMTIGGITTTYKLTKI